MVIIGRGDEPQEGQGAANQQQAPMQQQQAPQLLDQPDLPEQVVLDNIQDPQTISVLRRLEAKIHNQKQQIEHQQRLLAQVNSSQVHAQQPPVNMEQSHHVVNQQAGPSGSASINNPQPLIQTAPTAYRLPQPPVTDSGIQRLKGVQNRSSWKWHLMHALDGRGLRPVLTDPIIYPFGSPLEVATRQLLSATIDQTLVNKVSHCETAQDIWKCLRSLFENNTSFVLTDMISRMNSYKMKSLEDVENGISEIQSLASQIKSLGGHIDNYAIESAILRALPSSFESFIASWSFFDAEKRTIDNLQSHLLQSVGRMRSRNAFESNKSRALSARSPVKNRQSSSSAATNKPVKKLFCKYCKKTNHEIKDCLKLKRKRESEAPEKPTEKSPQNQANASEFTRQEVASDDSNHPQNRVAYGHTAKVLADLPVLSTSTAQVKYIDASWVADSGASFHMTSNLEWLVDYVEFSDKICVKLGDNHVVKAHGRGFIETEYGVLDPVYYLPDIGMNLFSVSSCAKNHKVYALTTDDEMIFLKDGEELFKGRLTSSGIYEIIFPIKLAEYSSLLPTSLMDWHDRLGHCSCEKILHMAKNKVVDGLFISDENLNKCKSCAKNKVHRAPHPSKTTPRANEPGRLLHFDTVGPFPTPSLSENYYYVLCKDSYSNYRQVFFVSNKSEIADKVKSIIIQSKLDTGNDALKIFTDHGTEFLKLSEFLKEKNILHGNSLEYTAEQNGFIERDIRTVAEAAGSLRSRAQLPKCFWAEAVITAVYLLNRIISSNNRDKTPYELWFNRRPSLKNIRRFGERAIVYIEKRQRGKLDEKGQEMIFVGYTENYNNLRFIHPETHELKISCNFVFLKNENYCDKEVKSDDKIEEIRVTIPIYNPIADENFDQSEAVQPGFINDQTFSIEDSTGHSRYDKQDESSESPSETPNNLTFNVNENSSVDGPSNSTFRLSREFQTPAKMSPELNRDQERLATLRPRNNRPNYINWRLNLTTSDSDSDPISFDEAMSRPDADKWRRAMQEELDSLKENEVWTLVNRPKNTNIVTNRWVFRIKRSPEGEIERYRARLVARGFSQVEGIDYFETYSPTASMVVVRVMFAHAAIKGLVIKQFDIKVAFLYGDLDETVYMFQPQGFEQGDKVCLLQRSLYGLKQAPRQWCRKFTQFLLDMKLSISSEDRCVFYKFDPFLVLIIYVDDGVVFAERQKDADDLVDNLSKRFKLHSMQLTTFLGFQIERPNPHHIKLHQKSYINKILTKFGPDESKTETSPISPTGLCDDETPLDPEFPYRQIIGSLLYAAITTRIDICFPVALASRFVSSPQQKHLFLVQRILRYLRGNQELALTYESRKHEGLIAFCDSDFANDKNGRSTSGILFIYGGGPVHWRSSRQTSTALSSSEAEIVSLCDAVKELVWLRNLMLELRLIDNNPVTIYCDNTSAIRIGTSEKAVHRTKHLRAKFYFCHEQVENKIIDIQYVNTNNQLADYLTKPLQVNKFIEARNKMMNNIFAKSLFVALLVSTVVFSAAYKFEEVSPILYQQTDMFVDTGVSEYTVDFTFFNPCNILNNYLPPTASQNFNKSATNQVVPTIPSQDEFYVRSFIDECNKLYHETFMLKINELLTRQPPPKQVLSNQFNELVRVKRSLVAEAVFAVCTTDLICTLFEPVLP